MTHLADPLEGHHTYRTVGILGRGNQGVVLLARKAGIYGNQSFAVKCMVKRSVGGPDIGISGRRWFYEALCLKRTRHCRVTAFHEVFNTSTHLCISMECVEGDDLRTIVEHQGCGFGEEHSLLLFRDIGFALRRIHSLGIAVRDLKGSNILINRRRTEAKICDLGFARPMASISSTKVGTPLYMAPEVLSIFESQEYFTYDGRVADIWSLGVVLYYMLFGRCPFLPELPLRESPHASVRRLILTQGLQFPARPVISQHCKDLIRRMLTIDPRERISINGVVQHAWFASRSNPVNNDIIYPPQHAMQTEENIRDVVNLAVIDTLHLNN